jgi:hypothetical protein
MPAPRRRWSTLVFATFLLVALAATGSACGDGGRPAAVSTLAPSTATTAAVTGTPSPGTTTNGAAGPSSGTTVAPTSTSSPTTPVSASPNALTDASLRADLIKRLGASPTLVGLEIEVRVAHRVVYLSGTVKSRAEKAAAEHIAMTEPGIAKVVSLLEVVPGGGGY